MDKKLLWVWLSIHFKEGTNLYKKLYDAFGSIEAIYDSDDADINSVPWLFATFKKKLLDKNLNNAKAIIEWCEKYDVDIITPDDENYPKALLEIDDYPAVLYCYGKLPDFENNLCITVVGKRDMSVYGKENAFNLGYGLTKGGAIVVSGMAKGIDCTAQKGALFAGGTTIAVLGCGINVVYPKENFELMLKIMKVGAVLTEYPPYAPPNAYNFPKRNRIMSALSNATVVVEAGRNSGSLITANMAKRQNKLVFAYPSSVNHFFSEGNNDLIFEDIAKLVTSPIDILEHFLDKYSLDLKSSKEKPVIKNVIRDKEFDFLPKGFWSYDRKHDKIRKPSKNKKEKRIKSVETNIESIINIDLTQLSNDEKIVYTAFKDEEKISMDILTDLCPSLDLGALSSTLMTLEIKGFISCLPGGFYIKK